MKAHTTSLINALILITLSLWGYFSSANPSLTAFIPTAIGFALLVLYQGVKNSHKTISHLAVVLTIIVLGGLVKPLIGAWQRDDTTALLRVGIMMLSTAVALFFFITSYMQLRKIRKKAKKQ